MIKATGSLDILGITGLDAESPTPSTSGAGIDRRLTELASWCPDYRLRLPQGAPFCLPGSPSPFDANAGMLYHSPSRDEEDSSEIKVDALRIARVTAVNSHDFDLQDRNPGGIERFLRLSTLREWVDTLSLTVSASAAGAGLGGIMDLFAQTVKELNIGVSHHQSTTSPNSAAGGGGNETTKRLLKVLLAPAVSFNSSDSPTPTDENIFLNVMSHGSAVRAGNKFVPALDELSAARQSMRERMLVCFRKRLFMTDQGELGLAPRAIEKGDILAVLPGSRAPVVLRRANVDDSAGGDADKVTRSLLHHRSAASPSIVRGNISSEAGKERWKVVGQCYLEGWMDGTKVQGGKWEEMVLS